MQPFSEKDHLWNALYSKFDELKNDKLRLAHYTNMLHERARGGGDGGTGSISRTEHLECRQKFDNHLV